ncbi:MAG TPA: hypothetical protein PLO33_15835 [Kouleothrix sp.]|uniref:hypothetical protein n=1 Tax=Kouleothrix sp. TaxID=2779161 RepID=UPI002CEAE103|nr:hypothetical protein [Kouleothrix sp.]HRC77151.1 hypothetical protein [Kouleothrix sp.]
MTPTTRSRRAYWQIGVLALVVGGLAVAVFALGAYFPAAQAPLGAAGSLPDPCSLLTQAEVDQALGAPPAEPIGEHELIDAECSYEPLAAHTAASVLVELTAVRSDAASFEQRARFFQHEGARAIGGFETAAYGKGGSVLVSKPGIIVFVILTDARRAPQSLGPAAQALAHAVLARLP